MFKKPLVLLLIGIFWLEPLAVYADEIIILDSLVEEAKKNNPEILAAKKRYEAALTRIPQAKSLDNPSVGFTFEKIPKGTLKLDRTMSDDRMLSITQMFPLFGKLSLKGKIALVESQMAASEYRNKELEVINAVKNAYYGLFLNIKEIELNTESLKFLDTISKIAQSRYVVGEIPQETLFKINLEIAELSTKIENLKQEQLSKNTRLNTLLNRQPEAVLGIPLIAEEVSFETDMDSLYRLTLENQPELLTFSSAIERNKYAKSLAKRSFLPDLMSGLVLRGITAGGIGPWDLMLSFTLPFWFWTKQRYEIKEAIANLEEAKASYEAMKNRAFAETKDLYTRIIMSKNKVKLYYVNMIPILEGSIGSSLSVFRSGKGDIMALLDNIRMLVGTKMDYYKALVEYNMSLADLERAVGVELNKRKNEK